MKTYSLIFSIILIFCFRITGQVKDSIKYISLSPVEFQLKYQKEEKAVLIDVREFFEYRKSRLKGAVNIPSSCNLNVSADTISKENALFFYCTTGFRSKRVAKFFSNKGFANVYSLEGGIVARRKTQLPVEKRRIKSRDSRLTTPAAGKKSP
jgi:rhodanese-related sulfurtransferase